jgi:hypothetical protein
MQPACAMKFRAIFLTRELQLRMGMANAARLEQLAGTTVYRNQLLLLPQNSGAGEGI